MVLPTSPSLFTAENRSLKSQPEFGSIIESIFRLICIFDRGVLNADYRLFDSIGC